MKNLLYEHQKNILLAGKTIKDKYARSEIMPFLPDQEQAKGKGFHYNGNEFIHHSSLHHKQTAFHRLNGLQMFIILMVILDLILGLFINWHTTLIVITGALTLLYFADLLFNFYLICRSFTNPAELKISDEEIEALQTRTWPTYTIFCPLYKEWKVLPQFIASMNKLDYPQDKLQIMLLLEEDDHESIQKIQEMKLPSFFETVIVPHSKPKTKPKACNYGLKYARGEYTVIYDAEDIPDPLQLKKAVIAFEKGNKKIICIQAKLNFYNPHQNLLTRIFTAEYSLWFDLVLTGLQSIQAPIPLGGTSNHFRTNDLHKLQGWDSFNVTEDADLGMRLVKQGYTTAIIDSITLEEANSDVRNWLGQRSRWIKGYMQTYLVHMRTLDDFRQKQKFHALIFQLVIGGKILSVFINPVMWTITLSYFIFRASFGPFIESIFPVPVVYMGLFSLVFGNFLYVYYYMIGSKKHGHHALVKYALFTPFYWLAMSIAAWIALYALIRTPHHWSKTRHGLYLHTDKNAHKLLLNQSL